MALSKAETILQRWDELLNQQRNWHSLWDDLAQYIQPRKSSIITQLPAGIRQTNKLFDSTGVHANELLAASMQGSLTSKSILWFMLRVRGLEVDADHEISLWLEDCAKRMYDVLNQSNAASEFHEAYQDLGGFGFATLFEEEVEPAYGGGFQGVRFTAMAPGTTCIDEDSDGRVDMVYRRVNLSARAAYRQWGDKLGPIVTQALKQNPSQRFDFIHAVYPREDYNPFGHSQGAGGMRYASCWVDKEDHSLLKEGGYREFPFAVPRWSKASGEVYGRGPGHTALPDIMTLNKAVQLKLSAWAKVVSPPLKVRDEGVIGVPKLTPGGLTHVRDMDAVQVLDLGGRFDIADLEEDKLRTSIRRVFFSDQLQLQEGPQMTAYEVQVRYELMQRLLGPTLGRLETEFLDPIINRTFQIMLRRRQFLPMPQSLKRHLADNDMTLDVKYEGPLARAQRLAESVAVQRFFQIVLPLAEADADVLDNVDLDSVVQLHGTSVGVPTRILRAPDQVAVIRTAKTQAREQAAQLQAAGQAAEAGGKAAPMLKALIESQRAGILPQSGATIGPTVPVANG